MINAFFVNQIINLLSVIKKKRFSNKYEDI